MGLKEPDQSKPAQNAIVQTIARETLLNHLVSDDIIITMSYNGFLT